MPRSNKNHLKRLSEHGRLEEHARGVFAPPTTAKRTRVARTDSTVPVGWRHQATIPPLSYGSEERGDVLMQIETHPYPVWVVLPYPVWVVLPYPVRVVLPTESIVKSLPVVTK
jgi:hypothetical protein|tara:strand:+ start:1238 stop:1576 length:339 start_codon:yes stop_codon:yes gene_type:complete